MEVGTPQIQFTPDLSPEAKRSGAKAAWYLRPAVISLWLVLLVVLPYIQVVHQEFVSYDDGVFVYDNPYVLKGFTAEGFRWAFGIQGLSQWHPLTWLSHMADCEMFGSWAGGHKLHNVLLHLANVVLLFHVMRLYTREILLSAVLAAIYGIHPLRVEAVAWVSERKEVLSTFFALWTLLAYRWYTLRPGVKRYLLVAFLFVLALMSKPIVVTLPCVMLLLDYWPLNRIMELSTRADWKRAFLLALEKLPLFLFVAFSSFMTMLCQYTARTVSSFEGWGYASRISNAAIAYMWYIRSTFVPFDLTMLYMLKGDMPYWQVAFSVAFLLLATWAIVRHSGRHRYLPTGWFFFLGTLVPAIGIVQVGAQRYADRYSYVPSIGLLIVIVWGGRELARRFNLRPVILRWGFAALLLILGTVSAIQVSFWQNNLALYTRCILVEPKNTVALNNLGSVFVGLGDLDKGLECFQEILRIDGDHLAATNNIGDIYSMRGDEVAAAQCFRAAIRIDPQSARSYANLGASLIKLEQYEYALNAMRISIRLDPDQARARVNYGVALDRNGYPEEALEQYKIAVNLNPNNKQANLMLGLEMFRLGRLDEAAKYSFEALRLDPTLETPRYVLTEVARARGQQVVATMPATVPSAGKP